MFENKTFETILSEMLSYVSDKNPELDTRTGSIIYTALAPIALELETAYHEMDMILDETFLDTASKEYLVKFGNQLGVEFNEATCGHFIGEFNASAKVEIGSRFNLDKFNYTIIKFLEDKTVYKTNSDGSFVLDSKDEKIPVFYYYEMVCETAGTEPNDHFGDLTPITYISNLSLAKLTTQLVYGEDEEDTESYRYRLQIHVKNPPVNGNVAQYNEWLDNYDGIGKYRVTPCWNGVNTVKLTILNSEGRADQTLVQAVQNYFDPGSTGMGDGVAPIGAIVTVNTVTEVPVTINCQLTLKDGYSSPIGVQEAVDEYLQSIVLNKTTVGYMPISAAIYNAESVEDVLGLAITVKGTTMDADDDDFVTSVTLSDSEIAILDTTNSVWGT